MKKNLTALIFGAALILFSERTAAQDTTGANKNFNQRSQPVSPAQQQVLINSQQEQRNGQPVINNDQQPVNNGQTTINGTTIPLHTSPPGQQTNDANKDSTSSPLNAQQTSPNGKQLPPHL